MSDTTSDIWFEIQAKLRELEKVIREDERESLIDAGWTSSDKPAWTPKEGELVEVLFNGDEWHPRSYSRGYCNGFHIRPHPTHIRWEDGKEPVNGLKAGDVFHNRINGRMYCIIPGKGWFWLEEE